MTVLFIARTEWKIWVFFLITLLTYMLRNVARFSSKKNCKRLSNPVNERCWGFLYKPLQHPGWIIAMPFCQRCQRKDCGTVFHRTLDWHVRLMFLNQSWRPTCSLSCIILKMFVCFLYVVLFLTIIAFFKNYFVLFLSHCKALWWKALYKYIYYYYYHYYDKLTSGALQSVSCFLICLHFESLDSQAKFSGFGCARILHFCFWTAAILMKRWRENNKSKSIDHFLDVRTFHWRLCRSGFEGFFHPLSQNFLNP